MTPTTPDRLGEIAARAEKATPGPWRAVSEGSSPYRIDAGGGPLLGFAYSVADQRFIAHARDDIPYLLALLDQARQEAAELKQRCSLLHDERHRFERERAGFAQEADELRGQMQRKHGDLAKDYWDAEERAEKAEQELAEAKADAKKAWEMYTAAHEGNKEAATIIIDLREQLARERKKLDEAYTVWAQRYDDATADRDEYANRLTKACVDTGIGVTESPLEVLTHYENIIEDLRGTLDEIATYGDVPGAGEHQPYNDVRDIARSKVESFPKRKQLPVAEIESLREQLARANAKAASVDCMRKEVDRLRTKLAAVEKDWQAQKTRAEIGWLEARDRGERLARAEQALRNTLLAKRYTDARGQIESYARAYSAAKPEGGAESSTGAAASLLGKYRDKVGPYEPPEGARTCDSCWHPYPHGICQYGRAWGSDACGCMHVNSAKPEEARCRTCLDGVVYGKVMGASPCPSCSGTGLAPAQACDGCARHVPLNEYGKHVGPGDYFACLAPGRGKA